MVTTSASKIFHYYSCLWLVMTGNFAIGIAKTLPLVCLLYCRKDRKHQGKECHNK